MLDEVICHLLEMLALELVVLPLWSAQPNIVKFLEPLGQQQ